MKNVVKLAKFFDEELNSTLSEVLVTKYQFGEYGLFGKYLVKLTPAGWYKVVVLKNKDAHEFTTLRNAVTWCTLQHADLGKQARRLQQLDAKLSSLQVEITLHKNMSRTSTNVYTKQMYRMKLQEDTFQKKQVVNEINSFINSSMMIQARKFDKSKERKFTYR
jgi:hypothetical protein